MKILDILRKEAIIVDLKSRDKKGVLEELVVPVANTANLDEEYITRALMERERLGTTGIGGGIGIPHGKLKDIKSLILGLGISKKGIDFESIDGLPVHIFFLLITPEDSTSLHLQMLSRISKILTNDFFKERLLNAVNGDEVVDIIKEEDENF